MAQVAGPGRRTALAAEFDTWQQGSEEYAGVDTELRMKLSMLYFFCNRPTLAALMAIGSDISTAAASVKEATGAADGEDMVDERPGAEGQPIFEVHKEGEAVVDSGACLLISEA